MTSARKSLLALLFALVPIGLGLFAFLARGGREESNDRPYAPPPRPQASEPAPVVQLVPPPEIRRAVGEAVRSTVLWPLKVELELVEARFLPRQEGVPAVGSGATAKLSGQVTGTDDLGVPVEVHFVAGANAGRVLRGDEGGRFGASDLYPGLSLVEVRGPGILGSRREVRLRRDKEQMLNIGYGRPGTVVGLVQDSSGTGIGGASVNVDGTVVTTGPEGEFYLASVAAGQVLVEVQMEGYALYQELVYVAGGGLNPKERLTFTLKPAAELRVAVSNNIGGPGPVQLYLLSDRKGSELTSASAYRNESFPWHRINPVEVWPGRPVTIGGLPAEVVKVHAFRPGARAPLKVVNLSGGRPYDLSIALEPAPQITGRVVHRGNPVLGASVRLEAPDRVRAMLGYFREPSYFLETAVLPNLAPAVQEVVSGKDGRFVLTAWEEESPVRYLEARGPDGHTWAGRFVQPKEREVEIELGEVNLGDSTLELEFPGRHQGLPVEVWIGGAPQETRVLAPEEALVLEKLLAGRWRLRVTWHAQPVFEEPELAIEDVTRLTIPLPPECIDGQDEETWRRAGKEYPRS